MVIKVFNDLAVDVHDKKAGLVFQAGQCADVLHDKAGGFTGTGLALCIRVDDFITTTVHYFSGGVVQIAAKRKPVGVHVLKLVGGVELKSAVFFLPGNNRSVGIIFLNMLVDHMISNGFHRICLSPVVGF